MNWLTALNSRLSRWAMYIACAGLISIVADVLTSVFMRYVLNSAPAWAEQIALLLVINVAMFGASAGVRDEGHIGMESLIGLLPQKAQFWFGSLVGIFTVVFGVMLVWGSAMMGLSVLGGTIPTL